MSVANVNSNLSRKFLIGLILYSIGVLILDLVMDRMERDRITSDDPIVIIFTTNFPEAASKRQ